MLCDPKLADVNNCEILAESGEVGTNQRASNSVKGFLRYTFLCTMKNIHVFKNVRNMLNVHQ